MEIFRNQCFLKDRRRVQRGGNDRIRDPLLSEAGVKALFHVG